jgi:hypothetical protein
LGGGLTQPHVTRVADSQVKSSKFREAGSRDRA